jgi:Tfp pilus assembly protein PilF
VESPFLRLSKTIIASGAIALMTSVGSLAGTPVQAAAAQQPAAGQAGAAPQKNYKDRGEYDLYSKITQTQDPKARLDLLNQWQDKYSQSDFAHDRDIYFRETLAQLANTDPSVRQKLIDKCNELLKTDPKDFRSNFLIALWGPVIGGASPSPDLLTQVQTAAQAAVDNAPSAFDAAKKPAAVSQADFDKAKSQALGIAHNALAWVATSKKDNATAENEYKASLEANPDQGNIPAIYGKMLVNDKRVPEGLFEYARAGQYTGPGALPEATRTQLMDYFNKAYKDYHGSMDGADQLLAQAKTSPLPPSGLNITSQVAQAQAAADDLNKRIAADPAFKIWYAIKQQLTGDQGDQFFSNSVKDTEVPGGAEGVKTFSGTVISIDPPDKPTKVVLGVEDPTKPDATLTFSKPLPASALDKIKVGQKIDFSGVADSYTKEPYMLTFGDPTIPGVQTTAPARTGRKRRGK